MFVVNLLDELSIVWREHQLDGRVVSASSTLTQARS
jgi:hypothetical protein